MKVESKRKQEARNLEVYLCDNYPLKMSYIIPVFDLISPDSEQIAMLKTIFESNNALLKNAFIVEAQVPLVFSVSAKAQFNNLKMIKPEASFFSFQGYKDKGIPLKRLPNLMERRSVEPSEYKHTYALYDASFTPKPHKTTNDSNYKIMFHFYNNDLENNNHANSITDSECFTTQELTELNNISKNIPFIFKCHNNSMRSKSAHPNDSYSSFD